jgi:hypothetical protein
MHIELTTYSTGYRIQNTETHVHKITDESVFYMAHGLNDFVILTRANPLLGLFQAQMVLERKG